MNLQSTIWKLVLISSTGLAVTLSGAMVAALFGGIVYVTGVISTLHTFRNDLVYADLSA